MARTAAYDHFGAQRLVDAVEFTCLEGLGRKENTVSRSVAGCLDGTASRSSLGRNGKVDRNGTRFHVAGDGSAGSHGDYSAAPVLQDYIRYALSLELLLRKGEFKNGNLAAEVEFYIAPAFALGNRKFGAHGLIVAQVALQARLLAACAGLIASRVVACGKGCRGLLTTENRLLLVGRSVRRNGRKRRK